MILFPIVTVIISLIVKVYIGVIYRRVIPEINENNYIDYQDVDKPNQYTVLLNSSSHPIYIDKALDANGNTSVISGNNINSGFSFSKHFNMRSESLYEENIIFGKTGFAFLSNLLQSMNVINIAWLSIMLTKYLPEFLLTNHLFYFIIFFFLFVFYFILICMFTHTSIKTLSILNCTEMNKNDENLKEVIKIQTAESTLLARKVCNTFRKIHFDLKIKSDRNFNSLNKAALKSLVDVTISRFNCILEDKDKKEELLASESVKKDDFCIEISELKQYCASTGNVMKNYDLEYILHFVDNFESLGTKGYLSRRDIYDIWGANIYYAKENQQAIMLEVFKRFDEEINYQEEANGEYGQELLKKFLNWYKEYFTKEELQFIMKQAGYLRSGFTKEIFVFQITTLCRHHPY